MVFDAALLNNVHYKVRIEGKWRNPAKEVATPHLDVVAIEKGALASLSTTVGQRILSEHSGILFSDLVFLHNNLCIIGTHV